MADVPEEVREYFRQIAKKGDYPRQGGDARAAALTPEERSAAAQKAAQARWGTKKKSAKKGKKAADK